MAVRSSRHPLAWLTAIGTLALAGACCDSAPIEMEPVPVGVGLEFDDALVGDDGTLLVSGTDRGAAVVWTVDPRLKRERASEEDRHALP